MVYPCLSGCELNKGEHPLQLESFLDRRNKMDGDGSLVLSNRALGIKAWFFVLVNHNHTSWELLTNHHSGVMVSHPMKALCRRERGNNPTVLKVVLIWSFKKKAGSLVIKLYMQSVKRRHSKNSLCGFGEIQVVLICSLVVRWSQRDLKWKRKLCQEWK